MSQLRILAGIQFSSPKFYPTLLPDEQYGQDGRSLTISVANNTGTLSITPNTSTSALSLGLRRTMYPIDIHPRTTDQALDTGPPAPSRVKDSRFA